METEDLGFEDTPPDKIPKRFYKKRSKPWDPNNFKSLVWHEKDCKCSGCTDRVPTACDLCGNTYKTRFGMLAHRRSHGPPRNPKPRPVLVPDGTGYIVRRMRKGVDTSEIKNFQSYLETLGHRRRFLGKYTLHNAFALEEHKKDPKKAWVIKTKVPGPIALLVGEVSKAANVNPTTVWCALVCYGIEKLAAELRLTKGKSAPPVRVPKTAFVPKSGATLLPVVDQTEERRFL